MASGPITSWQIDGETMEIVRDFILGGIINVPLLYFSPKSLHMVTAAMISWCLLLRRKAMTNLDSILKSRDITLPMNVHLVKAMVFPVVMYGCECWTLMKAEHRRIHACELWCWRRLLRVPWTARRSNQSILKEIIPEYSLEELMLKLQYFGHLMRRTDSYEKKRPWCWERLKAGGKGDDRWHPLLYDMCLCKLQDLEMDEEICRSSVHEVAKSWTGLSDWGELKMQ